MDEFRDYTLSKLKSVLYGNWEEMYDIYEGKVVAFENMDDEHAHWVKALYDQYTDREERSEDRKEAFKSGFKSLISDPVSFFESIGQSFSDTYEREGLAYVCGGAALEVGTLVIAPAKLAKVSKGADVLDTAGDISRAADKVSDAAEDIGRTANKFDEIVASLQEKSTVFNFEVEKLKLRTERDTAFFWSGKTEKMGGAKVAEGIARSKDGVTLEFTMVDKKIDLLEWDFNNPTSIKAWEDALFA